MTQSATVQPLNQEELISSSPHAKFRSVMNVYLIVSISHLDVSTSLEPYGLKHKLSMQDTVAAQEYDNSNKHSSERGRMEGDCGSHSSIAIPKSPGQRWQRWQRPPPLWGDALRLGSHPTSRSNGPVQFPPRRLSAL